MFGGSMAKPLMEHDRDQLGRAAEVVGRHLGARLVLLFGSAARGERRADADLDIGILGDGLIDVVDATNRMIQLLRRQDVDLTDLTRADPLLLMLAARDGVVLYERAPGESARFVSLAARRYADTQKFRAAERAAIRDFIGRSKSR